MTPLDKTLKRLLTIDGIDYVVNLSPDALKLTRKGRRLGMELKWADITSGESALAVALHASVGRFDQSKPAPSSKSNGSQTPESGTRKQSGPGTKAKTPRSRRGRP